MSGIGDSPYLFVLGWKSDDRTLPWGVYPSIEELMAAARVADARDEEVVAAAVYNTGLAHRTWDGRAEWVTPEELKGIMDEDPEDGTNEFFDVREYADGTKYIHRLGYFYWNGDDARRKDGVTVPYRLLECSWDLPIGFTQEELDESDNCMNEWIDDLTELEAKSIHHKWMKGTAMLDMADVTQDTPCGSYYGSTSPRGA